MDRASGITTKEDRHESRLAFLGGQPTEQRVVFKFNGLRDGYETNSKAADGGSVVVVDDYCPSTHAPADEETKKENKTTGTDGAVWEMENYNYTHLRRYPVVGCWLAKEERIANWAPLCEWLIRWTLTPPPLKNTGSGTVECGCGNCNIIYDIGNWVVCGIP